MKIISPIILLALGVLLLDSCAAPLALAVWESSSRNDYRYDDPYDYPTPDYPEYYDDYYTEEGALSLELENPHYKKPTSTVYRGEANVLKIKTIEGYEVDYDKLKWDLTAGRIEKTNEPGVYHLFIEEDSLYIELTITNQATEEQFYFFFYPTEFPTPKVSLKGIEQGKKIRIEDIKQLSELQLDFPALVFPELDFDENPDKANMKEDFCSCKSFRVTRIENNGKRELIENKTATFSAPLKTLMTKAKAGDIYIFDKIELECEGYQAKTTENMVFVLE